MYDFVSYGSVAQFEVLCYYPLTKPYGGVILIKEDNFVSLKGNVGKDLDFAYTPKGTATAKTSIAVSDKFGDREETTWVNLEFYGRTADLANMNLQKGDTVRVFGKLSIRSWKDDDGRWNNWTKVNVTHFEKLQRIVFPDSKGSTDFTEGFAEQLDEELGDVAPF